MAADSTTEKPPLEHSRGAAAVPLSGCILGGVMNCNDPFENANGLRRRDPA